MDSKVKLAYVKLAAAVMGNGKILELTIDDHVVESVMQKVSTVFPDDERSLFILTLRFGLDGEDSWSLKAVGDRFKVSENRIHQIEHKAMNRLRKTKNIGPFKAIQDLIIS